MKFFVIAATLVAVAFAAGPTGCVCGEVPGLVTGIKDCALTSKTFNISATVFGQPLSCASEPYVYVPPSTINLPNITDPSDCLGSQLSMYGLSPPTVTYDPTTNAITLDFGIATVQLTNCPTK